MTKYVVLRSKANWSFTTNCAYVIVDFVELETEEQMFDYVRKTLTNVEEVSSINENYLWLNRRELRDQYGKIFANDVVIVEYGVKRITYGFLKLDDLNKPF